MPLAAIGRPLVLGKAQEQRTKAYHQYRIRDGRISARDGTRSLPPHARTVTSTLRNGALNQGRRLVVWLSQIRRKVNGRNCRLSLKEGPSQTTLLVVRQNIFIFLFDFLQVFTGLSSHVLDNGHER